MSKTETTKHGFHLRNDPWAKGYRWGFVVGSLVVMFSVILAEAIYHG